MTDMQLRGKAKAIYHFYVFYAYFSSFRADIYQYSSSRPLF